MKKTNKEEIFCSFCESSQDDINLLIEGNEVYICDLCIVKASDVISENKNKNDKNIFNILKPSDIKNELDKYIITQNRAKKYKEILNNKKKNVKTRSNN